MSVFQVVEEFCLLVRKHYDYEVLGCWRVLEMDVTKMKFGDDM